ncbi:peroxidase 67-like, partial [Carica papaya]|uniref:peroxidase 67-like n=1 Tax=Carica papaya TaxID=3649 RepID=UPI000B8CB7AD
MVCSCSSCLKAIFARLCLLLLLSNNSYAQLSPDFYAETCPKVLVTVRSVLRDAVAKEPRMGASLLRLHFHDCFVNGCDASVLLDDTPTFVGEKTAVANNNSLRGYEVVDAIKVKLEEVCPGIVSCADILAIAARDSVVLLGGPNWIVKLGRRDSKTASLASANSGVIPPPSATLNQLINRFQAQGLSPTDLIALTGGHTIGKIRCVLFRDRIYNE